MKELLRHLDLAKDPAENTAALHELYTLVLEQLREGNRTDLEVAAVQLAEFVNGHRRLSPANQSLRQSVWYLGHLQFALGLYRAAITHELPHELIAFATQKHIRRMLRALRRGDRTSSQLARELRIDQGRADSEIAKMADWDLVRIQTQERQRWISVTNTGKALLKGSRKDRRSWNLTSSEIQRMVTQLIQRQATREAQSPDSLAPEREILAREAISSATTPPPLEGGGVQPRTSQIVPASATLVWTFPTQFEEVRCLVWEGQHGEWHVVVMMGKETLAHEIAPTRWAMESGVDLIWRGMLNGFAGETVRPLTSDGSQRMEHRKEEGAQDDRKQPKGN